MTTAKREAHARVRVALGAKTDAQSSIITNAFDPRHVRRDEAQLDAALARTSNDYIFSLLLLRRDDGAHARTYDCGLLGGDLGERVAQVFLMVERDGRDGDDVCVCRGRRVESSAESGFKNCYGDARRAEGFERDG